MDQAEPQRSFELLTPGDNGEHPREETELIQCVARTIGKVNSAFLPCFVTVANRELVVLKCFENKNVCFNKAFLPAERTVLRKDSFGNNAIALSSIKGDIASVVGDEHSRKQSWPLSCVGGPLRLVQEVVGYLSISVVEKKLNITWLRSFMEILIYSVEHEIVLKRLYDRLGDYLANCGLEAPREVPYFTGKEKEVVGSLLKAYPYDVIADELGISEKTVRNHLKRIYEKCGTRSRVDTAILLVCNELADLVRV